MFGRNTLIRNKYFKHDFLSFDELQTEYTEEGRFYITPTGEKYKSVTTILGNYGDKTGLDAWRERVGDAEADRVSRVATERGTMLHNLAEKYILNDENFSIDSNVFAKALFNKIEPYLTKNINTVYGTEFCLYSHVLKTAGRCDLLATYNDTISIIDYKTSSREKQPEWIENYFIQATAYALMVEELTNISIPQLVILIAVQDGNAQEFIRSTSDFKDKTIKFFKEQTNV